VKKYLILILSIINFSSFAQKDTLDYTINRWTVDEYQNKIYTPIDTNLDGFQIYIPIYFRDFSQAYNGNAGQAYQNNYYLNRKEHSFYFFKPYYDYLFLDENAKFYNTKQQYTKLHYYTNFTKKNNLQNVDLMHNQNITPFLNIGFQYRLLGADGEYKAQKSSNHFFRAFAAYDYKNYEAHLVYNYNKFNSYLNGGVTSDTLLDNPNTNNPDTKTIPVYLDNSKNSILGRNLNLKHNYKFYSKTVIDSLDTTNITKARAIFKIGHNLDWNYNKRLYSNEGSSGFYKESFIDTSALSGGLVTDSTGYTNFSNTFFITFLDDSINNSLPEISIAYTNTQEFFHSYNNTKNYTQHIAKLLLRNPIYNKWYWDFGAEYTFAGGNKGDFNLNGTILKFFGRNKQHHIRFQPSFSQTSPNIFTQSYSSHFYKWDKTFDKFALTTFDFAYHHDKLKLEVGVKQAYLDNYVYFASKQDSVHNGSQVSYETIAGYPFQETSTFGILSFYLNHRLDWGPFHMKNSVTYQKISNDSTLHIPEITYYNSTYFQMHFFKHVLMVQVGFDLRYNSAYLIDGFMPATGLYYNQYQKEFGDYPYFDFFINMKLKRARIFLKMDHINKGLNGNQYYTVLNHPMNPRVFRFGLSWIFWN